MAKGIDSIKVVLTAPESDILKGSVKWDGGASDDYKQGIPLIAFPSFRMEAPHEPTSGSGKQTSSLSSHPLTICTAYDKATARVLTPLIKGDNLKKVIITETGRANKEDEVTLRTLTITDSYLTEVMWYWDERLFSALTPGGVLVLSFKYTRVDLVATQFDAAMQPTGKVENGFLTTNASAV